MLLSRLVDGKWTENDIQDPLGQMMALLQDRTAVGGVVSGPRHAGWASQVWHYKSGVTG